MMRARLAAWILAIASVIAGPALASSFGVSPMRVDFGAGDRTTTITVDNDGDEETAFQVTLAAWHQTPDGKDEYAESHDLIFFPQIFSIAPHGKRIIRVGVKGPPADAEKAYRLYIAEMPAPAKSKQTGPAQVRVVLRFGVAVFVAPKAPRRDVAMDEPRIEKGKLWVTMRNQGNESVKFDTLDVMRDKDSLAQSYGTYILPGVAHTFEIRMDAAKCIGSGTLELVAHGEGTTVKRSFNAAPALCEHS